MRRTGRRSPRSQFSFITVRKPFIPVLKRVKTSVGERFMRCVVRQVSSMQENLDLLLRAKTPAHPSLHQRIRSLCAVFNKLPRSTGSHNPSEFPCCRLADQHKARHSTSKQGSSSNYSSPKIPSSRPCDAADSRGRNLSRCLRRSRCRSTGRASCGFPTTP